MFFRAPSGPPHSGSGGQSGAMPGLSDPSAMMNPMMANMAMQYGQDIVGKGQEELKKNLDKYVSIGQLKYYFAVDNSYVGKKLGKNSSHICSFSLLYYVFYSALLLFPFTHSDWSIKYSQDEPVQPKFDLNAPDLYIPCMAYVTYILVVGYVLGIRQAFSPGQKSGLVIIKAKYSRFYIDRFVGHDGVFSSCLADSGVRCHLSYTYRHEY